MEDLDPQRSRGEYAEAAIEDLRWMGIRWQEGPDVGGPYAPYIQSERRSLYEAAFHTLRESGRIYPCRCSRKDLASAAQAPHEAGQDDEPCIQEPAGRMGHARSAAAMEQGTGANWRFRVPDGEAIEFVDGNFGAQQFVAGEHFGDFLVWRRDGVPSYQLAVVVDDAAMRITEVVRGADLLKSTARQILLYHALGMAAPGWYHCPLVTAPNGRRISKREDGLSLRSLRLAGVKAETALSVNHEPRR